MSATVTGYVRRATRVATVEHVNIAKDGWVEGHFRMHNRHLHSVAFRPDDPALIPFTDSDGKIDALLALEGRRVKIAFDDLTDDDWIHRATIVSIKKVEGPACKQ